MERSRRRLSPGAMIPILALLLAGFSDGALQAQDADSRRIQRLVFPGQISSVPEGDVTRVSILGGFHLSFGDRTLEAENAVLWLDLPKPGEERSENTPPTEEGDTSSVLLQESIREIYAEGGVFYQNGLETVRASQIYLDLLDETGMIIEATIRTPLKAFDPEETAVIRAAQLRQIGRDRFEAYGASLTTCTYGHPHYHVRTSHLALTREPEESERGDLVEIEGNALVLGDRLLTPLPSGSYRVGDEAPVPLKSLSLGRSSDYGLFLLSRWGQDIDAWGEAFNEKLGIDEPFSGDWFVDLDFYSRRGLGLGGGFEWKSGDRYFGELESYYIQDRKDEDGDGTPVENDDRGRIRFLNRADLGEGWRLDTELSYISERHFLEEYYEREAKEEKEQETYAYLRKLWDQQGLTFLSRHRLNDFDSQTEYLPRAAARSIDQRVLTFSDEADIHLYHTNFSEASHVRRLASDQLEGSQDFSSERLGRVDTVDRFDTPIQFGRLTFSPFYENRLSYFSEAIEDDDGTYRFGGSAGARMQTQLHRTFGVDNETLGLDGLRHIMIPEIQYANTFALNRSSDELIAIDSIEDYDKVEVVLLRLDQRFQTLRPRNETKEVHDFLWVELEQPIYPDENRDNDGNTLGNFYWESYLRTLVNPYPVKNLSVLSEAEWNWDRSRLDRFNVGARALAAPGLTARISYRNRKNSFEILTLGASYRLSAKWELDFLNQHDLETGDSLEQRLGFRRYSHDWVAELSVSHDAGENDTSLRLSVSPLLLFDDPQGAPRGFRNQPLFDPTVIP